MAEDFTTYRTRIADEVFREFNELAGWRNTFASHWEEVAELIRPSFRNTFYYTSFDYPGQKKTQRQIDSTGQLASSRFAAIVNSLTSPRNQRYHGLTASEPELMKDRASRLWFEDTTLRLFRARYASTANFPSQNLQTYRSMGDFGTGCTFIDEFQGRRGEQGLRYKSVPLGECYLQENHQGIIDGLARPFKLTARQAIQKWGKERLPEQVLTAAEGKKETWFNFIHRVKPREDYDPDRLDEKGKEYVSYYTSVEGKSLISEGGYTSFPLASCRYEQAPNEVYGRGPAMMVLPALKTLNAEKTTFLKAGHRAADPVMLSADDGIVDFSLRPGAMNKGGWSADGKPLIGTLPIGNIQTTKEMMDEERNLINDAFLVTLFQILVETPTMTATEVIERINEKGILLAPTLDVLQGEYFGSLIHRELDIMSRLGMLAPMPPALQEAGGEYNVTYSAPLNRAQQAQDAAGFLRAVESALTITNATGDASIMDPFNFDVAMPDVARIQGTPEKWLASPDDVKLKRTQRAADRKRQEQIAAAPAAAAMIKAGAVAEKAGK